MQIVEWIDRFIRVVQSACRRFYWDDGLSRAASLAYTSLFAMLPLTALSFSMFRVFHLEEAQVGEMLRRVIAQFLPKVESSDIESLQSTVFNNLEMFLGNVAALNTLSVAAFVVTAIALFNSIESAMNSVFRVHSDRSWFIKITTFWAVITLTPAMIAVSLYWTSKANFFSDVDSVLPHWILALTDFLIPVLITWLGVTLLFYKLPAARVRLSEAALGAFISSVLFELLKLAFAYYLKRATAYLTLYGVVASIPLFLFWLYLTWVVLLFGAEISYQWGSVRIMSGLRRYASDLGDMGAMLGLRVLYCIGKSFKEGRRPPTEGEIAIETGTDPVLVRGALALLSEGEIVTVADTDTRSHALLVPPDKLTVRQVMDAFLSKSYKRRLASGGSADQPNGESFIGIIERTSKQSANGRQVLDWTLEDLIKA